MVKFIASVYWYWSEHKAFKQVVQSIWSGVQVFPMSPNKLAFLHVTPFDSHQNSGLWLVGGQPCNGTIGNPFLLIPRCRGRIIVIEKHVRNMQLLLPFRRSASVLPDFDVVLLQRVTQTRSQSLIKGFSDWIKRCLSRLISHIFSN